MGRALRARPAQRATHRHGDITETVNQRNTNGESRLHATKTLNSGEAEQS
jgi:hypothetical protein